MQRRQIFSDGIFDNADRTAGVGNPGFYADAQHIADDFTFDLCR